MKIFSKIFLLVFFYFFVINDPSQRMEGGKILMQGQSLAVQMKNSLNFFHHVFAFFHNQ